MNLWMLAPSGGHFATYKNLGTTYRGFFKMNSLIYSQLNLKFLNVILKSFYTAILVTSK